VGAVGGPGGHNGGVGLALFDLDNTLVDRQRAFVGWAEAFAARHGLDDGAVGWICSVDGDGHASREAVFTAVREHFGLRAPVHELIEEYRRAYPSHYRPEPAVLGALADLRADGWAVGVVTNGPPTQREKVERTGLSPLVDACCISEELGVAKPDPRIFAEAARRCGFERASVMVGDTAVPDVAGGQAAGLATVWLDRGRRWEEVGFAPDVVVADVIEAIRLLVTGTWPLDRPPAGRPERSRR